MKRNSHFYFLAQMIIQIFLLMKAAINQIWNQ